MKIQSKVIIKVTSLLLLLLLVSSVPVSAAPFSEDLIPDTDNTYNIGSPTARWKSLFTGPLNALENGNVGIGTTTPGSLLHISKSQNAATTLRIDNSDSTGGNTLAGTGLNFYEGSTWKSTIFSANSVGTAYAGGVNALQIWNLTTDGHIIFATGTNEKMRLTNAGNLGIGTGNPAAKLAVSGSGDPAILLLSGGSGSYTSYGLGRTAREANWAIAGAGGQFSSLSSAGDVIFRNITEDIIISAQNATGKIRFSTGASDTEKMTITSGGNVGIGSASPAQKLDVNGTLRVNKIESSSTTTGTGTITSGQTSVTVSTSAISDNSKILVTPNKAVSIGVTAKNTVAGTFTVSIASSLGSDLKFDWLLVDQQ